jgi:hypothetical protein
MTNGGSRPPYISISERLLALVRAVGLANWLLIIIAVMLAVIVWR